MEDFTPDQRTGIIRSYCNMAQALNEYQVVHWPELSHEQHLDLNAYQNSLLNRAQDLQTLASRPAFVDVTEMAERIQQATADAQSSLKHIHNLPLALNVGAITVALAAYVARANLRGIQTALRELSELLLLEKKAE
ncbi:hypothetical protein GO755_29450 [Spirosoma sp. HMF4905]|uniref:Uncharacterized protein n=1 Tax=Spirosoma arboris TaxID=2682092 RepID=A0A7K1SKB0_9BACT|nr:hypothetical protein [Spirosoma arboris]MVM34194.1 hypothetical protein [Spirosoma arboris]